VRLLPQGPMKMMGDASYRSTNYFRLVTTASFLQRPQVNGSAFLRRIEPKLVPVVT